MMKKTTFVLILALVAVVMAGATSCSTIRGNRATNSEQARKDSAAWVRSAQLLSSHSFLIKAKTIRVADIGTKQVIPENNYIWVNDGRCGIQISPEFTGGRNGVGGSTGEVAVESIKEKVEKNGELFVTIRFILGGSITITLPPNSGTAMVTNGWFTLYGVPQPYDPSQVIEGAFNP